MENKNRIIVYIVFEKKERNKELKKN